MSYSSAVVMTAPAAITTRQEPSMTRRSRSHWRGPLASSFLVLLALATGFSGATAAPANAASTTAWKDGHFQVDRQAVLSRSDIVLRAAPLQAVQSMPLGNGTLGAAVWAANGFTAQLNRADTLPDRKSPGWLTIPGLARLTTAKDYTGRVSLYDGVFTQTGGGMSATTYVRADTDELVVDVTGADPSTPQTAQVSLWNERSPVAAVSGTIGTLAETWTDGLGTTATHQTFGSLAALTASGRNVTTSRVDSRTVQVTVTPTSVGAFRIVVGAPTWTGGDPAATAATLLTGADTASNSTHLAWWHGFWARAGILKITSKDGSGEYLENLRAIGLYTIAAENRGNLPGTQAGVGDLFDFSKDFHRWVPSTYWHWNIRMQTSATLGAGVSELNDPYFRLYRDNLANIQSWTNTHMNGRAGTCVPETMRFSGSSYDCNSAGGASYHVRAVSTGAEVGLWVWQQYRYTGDREFLAANYPLMAESARFLLAYATLGEDGKLHTYPSNAHETQWDVHDPTTDIAAEKALFPATIQAATTLGKDPDLVTRLDTALGQLVPFPTTGTAGKDVIAPSVDRDATNHNTENIGLEPVWPYDLIGDDDGAATDLARRTFTKRPYKFRTDWTPDPIQAAHLGLPADVKDTLIGLTRFQVFASGLADVFGRQGREPYAEANGVIATALQDALVDDHDDLLRVAPAWPADWDVDGTVSVHDNARVDVQVRAGVPVTVAIEAGAEATMVVRNPWPGQKIRVVDGMSQSVVADATSGPTVTVPVVAGRSYLVELVAKPTTLRPFAAISGAAATEPRILTDSKSKNTSTIGIAATASVVDVGAGHRFLR